MFHNYIKYSHTFFKMMTNSFDTNDVVSDMFAPVSAGNVSASSKGVGNDSGDSDEDQDDDCDTGTDGGNSNSGAGGVDSGAGGVLISSVASSVASVSSNGSESVVVVGLNTSVTVEEPQIEEEPERERLLKDICDQVTKGSIESLFKDHTNSLRELVKVFTTSNAGLLLTLFIILFVDDKRFFFPDERAILAEQLLQIKWVPIVQAVGQFLSLRGLAYLEVSDVML
jgi:hypothetical protein